MSERRFAGFTIEALEKLFDENRKVLPTLESIAAELAYRKTKRAKDLQARVAQAIGVFGSLETPENDEPWSTYERGLTDRERAVILASPMTSFAPNAHGDLFDDSLAFWRRSEHLLLEIVWPAFETDTPQIGADTDIYGLVMRMAEFELSRETVSRWPAFALLFRKMLGENALPWLPSLYLGAAALVPGFDIRTDLDELLAFRDKFGQRKDASNQPPSA
ncbi:MAG: hypothetical protein U1E15_05175 [Hyphomicrobiales bacterium]